MRGQTGRSLFSQRLKAGRRNRKTSRLSPGSPRKAREVAHLAGSYPGLKGWFSDAAHTRPLQKRKERGTPVELGVAEGAGPPARKERGTPIELGVAERAGPPAFLSPGFLSPGFSQVFQSSPFALLR